MIGHAATGVGGVRRGTDGRAPSTTGRFGWVGRRARGLTYRYSPADRQGGTRTPSRARKAVRAAAGSAPRGRGGATLPSLARGSNGLPGQRARHHPHTATSLLLCPPLHEIRDACWIRAPCRGGGGGGGVATLYVLRYGRGPGAGVGSALGWLRCPPQKKKSLPLPPPPGRVAGCGGGPARRRRYHCRGDPVPCAVGGAPGRCNGRRGLAGLMLCRGVLPAHPPRLDTHAPPPAPPPFPCPPSFLPPHPPSSRRWGRRARVRPSEWLAPHPPSPSPVAPGDFPSRHQWRPARRGSVPS